MSKIGLNLTRVVTTFPLPLFPSDLFIYVSLFSAKALYRATTSSVQHQTGSYNSHKVPTPAAIWKWKWKWHTTKYGDPYSEFVLCIYPILSAHTQQWTHTHREHAPGAVGSHLCCGARGAVGVRCLAQGHLSRGIEGGESTVHSFPIHSGQQVYIPSLFQETLLEFECPHWIRTSFKHFFHSFYRNVTISL